MRDSENHVAGSVADPSASVPQQAGGNGVVSDLVAALREAETEVAEIKKNIIEVRAENYRGVAHPRFDAESQKELARIEAMLGRIRAAIAKASGLSK